MVLISAGMLHEVGEYGLCSLYSLQRRAHEQHTTEMTRPVVQTTTTNVTYNISAEWNEVEIDSRIGRVSNMYKPFDLDSVIEETDLVFSGTVINRKEYEVKWTDENGEKVHYSRPIKDRAHGGFGYGFGYSPRTHRFGFGFGTGTINFH